MIHGETDKHASPHGTIVSSLIFASTSSGPNTILSTASSDAPFLQYDVYFSARKSNGYNYSFVCCDLCAFKFDVWLTVHRIPTWNKKPNRCHLVLYLFPIYKLLNMFRATLCPCLHSHGTTPHAKKYH